MVVARELATAVLVDPAPLDVLGPIVGAADELGYEYCYVADQGVGDDIYVLLGALAVQTSRIRSGPWCNQPLHETSRGDGDRDRHSRRGERGTGISRSWCWWNPAVGGPRSGSAGHRSRRAPTLSRAPELRGRDPCEVHWAARGPRMMEAGARLADVMVLNGHRPSRVVDGHRINW